MSRPLTSNPHAPSSSVHIRPAGPADLDAIDALERGAFAQDRFARRNLRRLLTRPSALVLLAERAGEHGPERVGYALILYRRNATVARLYSIAVDETARGQGIGPALVEEAARHAAQRGCRRLRLEVRRSNGAAQRSYERSAFRRTGIRPAYYDDGEDAVIMETEIAMREHTQS
ncbi:GNAT family N-acetyltransferase [Marinicauda sp. Alg238-R41]|uniref:GNAT family N-acetyltransferase n=1 Tax=Marinicauda sp. Alg238-R41 TaxID=2993447 RepID=UPI0022E20962|nr:GNAT family N-acetyltransferase [Marinicauda sp. Alg238-R41]